MAKEFEGLEEVIRDISGDVEKMSSDAALIKSLEKYIKEDPLAYLGWQMYKMNLIGMSASQQNFGENLIKFDNGRKIELGGIYSRKGAKAIPVRTGFEKSENVVVFDENAPTLGSVIYTEGAREESLESVTILHELRHVASMHLKNKYPNEYFDDETDHKIEEDQQRIIDLYTLISTGDYKDGNIGFRGAHAFADSKDFGTSLLLASKNTRLALKELDSLNVPVSDEMRNTVKKMKTVFEFELGEKDQEYIQLVRESIGKSKLKEEHGDAHMMELEDKNSNMDIDNDSARNSKFFEILTQFESVEGNREAISPDLEYTKGSYHVKHKNGKDLSELYPDSDAAKIYSDFSAAHPNLKGEKLKRAWGDYMYENPEAEQTVSNQLLINHNTSLRNNLSYGQIEPNFLTDEEYAGLHLYMWNMGTRETLTSVAGAFSRLTKFRKLALESPNHPHINEINEHINTLKNAACATLYRKPSEKTKDGHFIRDANSRSLCFNGTMLGKGIDATEYQSKGFDANQKAQSVLNSYKETERPFQFYRDSAPPPSQSAPVPPRKPNESQPLSQPPLIEEVSPGVPKMPPDNVRGEVVDIDLLSTPDVVTGDL